MISRRVKWRMAILISLVYLLIPYTLGIESDVRITDQLTFLINWIIVALIVAWFVCRIHSINVLELILLGVFVFYLFMLHQLVSYIPVSFYLSGEYTGDLSVTWGNFNLVPFQTIQRVFTNPISDTQHLIQSGGNLLLLLPFAFFLRLFGLTASAVKAGIAAFLISVGIESFQFVLNLLASGHAGVIPNGKTRTIDIDDVILNTLGGYLGALLYSIYEREIKNRKR